MKGHFMKNSLLLTTALVALASAAHAETKQIVINHGETQTVEGIYNEYSGFERGGVIQNS